MPNPESARAWYPSSDPVHGFDHVLRVYQLAEDLAQAEGADLEIVRAAALLHDAEGGVESEKPSLLSQSQVSDGSVDSGQISVVGDEPWPDDLRPAVADRLGLTFAQAGRRSGRQSSISNQQSKIDDARLTHHHASAEFAAQVLQAEGWSEGRIAEVQHCIRAHRFRDESEAPNSLEAKVLFDADKLDAIGAVGVARAIGYALQAGQPAYARPSAQFIETGELAPGEPHSAYHEYIFKLRRIKERIYTPAGRRLAEERHQVMAEFFERLAEEMEGK